MPRAALFSRTSLLTFPMSLTTPPSAIILAAGKGTRMKSDLPKVVFPIGGRPMVCAVVDACRAAGVGRVVAIVGYKQEEVRSALKDYDVEFAVQEEQLGTGHAVMSAAGAFTNVNITDTSLVLCGDGPLIRAATITQMLERHSAAGASATLATAIIDNPAGYGRIDRDAGGNFRAIVEHKNCTPAQLNICEVNPSYYCFNTASLFSTLRLVKRNPVSNEYYITDVPELMLARGERVEVIGAVPPQDIYSINTPEDLEHVDSIFRARATTSGATR